jgi:hypothetical protein
MEKLQSASLDTKNTSENSLNKLFQLTPKTLSKKGRNQPN